MFVYFDNCLAVLVKMSDASSIGSFMNSISHSGKFVSCGAMRSGLPIVWVTVCFLWYQPPLFFFGSRLTPVGDLSVSECGSKFICGVSFRYVGERGCGWLAVVVVVLHWVFPVCPPAGKGAHCNERSNFIDFAKSFLFRYGVSGDWCFCCFTGFFLIFLELFSTHISPLIFPVIRVSPLFSLLDFPFFRFHCWLLFLFLSCRCWPGGIFSPLPLCLFLYLRNCFNVYRFSRHRRRCLLWNFAVSAIVYIWWGWNPPLRRHSAKYTLYMCVRIGNIFSYTDILAIIIWIRNKICL